MRTATTSTKIKVGVFILAVVFIAAVSLMLAGDELSFFRQSRTFKTEFTNAAGLIAGAPVRIGGVDVGRVAEVAIETRNQRPTIVASIKIDSPYYKLLTSDATVGLDTQGLLGDKFIDLTPGHGGKQLAEGELIKTRELEGLPRVLEKSSDIVDTIDSTTRKIDAFATGLPEAEVIRAISEDFMESSRALRVLITQLAARDSFIATLNDTESKELLKKSLNHLASTAAHMNSIAQKIDEGQGTLGALINDHTLYEDIRSVLGRPDRGKIARRVFIEATSTDSPPAPQ
jgi:phospholipid/cholesterol/gamma-HCH transport system substrate-binding protein